MAKEEELTEERGTKITPGQESKALGTSIRIVQMWMATESILREMNREGLLDSLKKATTRLERAVKKRDIGEVELLADTIKHIGNRYRTHAGWILNGSRGILGCREEESLEECYERLERRLKPKFPPCRTGESFKECYERVRKEMGLPGIPI